MRWLFLIALLLLSACTTTHFGVPEEAWKRMGEAERLEAMRSYNERARLREEAAQREAEARRLAERDARAGRLTFDPAWRHGARYRLDTRGPLELRGAKVMVSAVPMRGG